MNKTQTIEINNNKKKYIKTDHIRENSKSMKM